MRTQEALSTENETFLGISRVFSYDFFQAILFDTTLNYFGLSIVVNEVNSRNSRTSKNLINLSRKNSHFHGVSSGLEMTFQIQALFKDFKDLHEPCALLHGQLVIMTRAAVRGQEGQLAPRVSRSKGTHNIQCFKVCGASQRNWQ